MRILLTGASGFIGSHLAAALQGNATLLNFYRPSAEKNLNDIDFGLFHKEFDLVIHCASKSPGDISATFMRDNVGPTLKLAHAAMMGGARFIYLSSMSVYGAVHVPVVEPDTPCDPHDAYGLSKLRAERVIEASGIPAVVLRLPGVIGPGAHRNWIMRSRGASRVAVHSAGAHFNNAVHVDDLARFILHLVDHDFGGFHVLTMASAGLITVAEAVSIIAPDAKIDEDRWAIGSPYAISIADAQAMGWDPMGITEALEAYQNEP